MKALTAKERTELKKLNRRIQTSKKPSDSFTPQNITADLIDGPITVEKMASGS